MAEDVEQEQAEANVLEEGAVVALEKEGVCAGLQTLEEALILGNLE